MLNSKNYLTIKPQMWLTSLMLLTTFFLTFDTNLKAAEKFQVPRLTSPVIDQANLLDRRKSQSLSVILKRIKRDTGIQIAVLTLDELNEIPIEQISIEVTDKWKLGSEKGDKGVLLLIAKKERRIRIEVGQGLEGTLTDAHSKRIIDENMIPLMKAGDSAAAITIGLYGIAKFTSPEKDMRAYFEASTSHTSSRNRRQSRPLSLFEIILYGFILLVMISTRTGRHILFFILITSRRGGGGFGGGGGGGYSGGGGGFSGGGASGGW